MFVVHNESKLVFRIESDCLEKLKIMHEFQIYSKENKLNNVLINLVFINELKYVLKLCL